MNEMEIEFDDFKPASDESSYASEAVHNILDKETSEVEEFKEDSIDMPIMMSDNPKDELTNMILGYIQGVGDVNQVNLCSYQTKNGVALDGWGFNGDEDMTTIDLFLTVFVNPEDSTTISGKEIDRHFNWLVRFYDNSLSGSILNSLPKKVDDLRQIAELINQTEKINRIRLFLLTNAIAPATYEKDDIELEDGTICEYHIWDARRIMRQDRIISGRDSIKVNFEGDYNCTLPCIKMPDISDNVSCYLCIIPGLVLSQVYHKYHQQILESNVRTFLQFKGASNKGIRNTLIGYKARKAKEVDVDAEPDMFFAYNNGISATATHVELNEERNAIISIKDWQIVNGGQTTASINAVMGMKDVDLTQLAKVYVSMKISVIKDKDKTSLIVPKISRFANTQSAVKKSDFDINEQFLIELEQQSREEWVLNAQNKPVCKWFFERTRGQYLDKAKRNSSAKAEREFYAEYPKNFMFDKTMLSKFMMAWDQNPASVCKGGENNYSVFFEKMRKSGVRFDKTRYHRTIAKAILFKAIDAYYGKDGAQLAGYKSNMVAYTVAALSYLSGKSLDLDTIWKEQCVITQSVYNELTIDIFSVYAKLVCGASQVSYKIKESYTTAEGKRKNHYVPKTIPEDDLAKMRQTKLYQVLEFVKKIHPFIYDHITKINEGENINEWTKKTLCWDALKTKLGNQGTSFNVPKNLCSSAGDLDVEVTEGQKKYIEEASEVPAETWLSINKWAKNNDSLSPKETAFIGQVGYSISKGRVLTYKQAKWALDILDKAKDNGWEE